MILPVYNRARALPRAVGSVLEQGLANFELVIVDDGSTDDSLAVARTFEDDRVKVIELGQNRGPSAARNAGIRKARAPLIAFLDSDDSYLPDKLECVVAEFDRRPELDLLVDSFLKVQPSGKQVVRRNPIIEEPSAFRQALFTRRLWKATPAITVRRDAILRAGLFDEGLRWLEDFDLLIRMSELGRCASTNAICWVKYWDPDAISGGEDLVEANVELARRHPCYLSIREYRPGLSFILRRALWRRFKIANFAGAARDMKQIAGAFGVREALRLLCGALFQYRLAQ